ncbi:MAG: Gldg family protein [Desulfobulbaceae bacterium]|nr:Gldg family protein [Desulfobulbaceae bacterium]
MSPILAITCKELKIYFGTPMAAIFIGAFLLVSLFSFFWLETFFARNIADIRPLFRWMPMLMVFLSAALTMRQWSEEQKMGTLEVLLTLPVKIYQLVLGKFLAVIILSAIALLLTLGLPFSVATIGNLDWGPVIAGYFGTLLMTCAYISIGLFISSRTDNQIIALMLTVLVSGFFYAIGSSGITDFFGNSAADFLRNIGTGSRFASIERGVIDLRDIMYYLTLCFFFLSANIFYLDRKRWSFGENTRTYRKKALMAFVLISLNLVAVNIWLAQVDSARFDITENKEYSLSAATKDLIGSLPEPLTMRGYFSAKTHPLLSPLVPHIKDLMTEYRIASNGMINVSFVDPKFDEKLEESAAHYGIKPVPFQVAGRYEAAVINSYFHILIQYGDQFVTLGFNDLIEAKQRADGQLEVNLRNLEYDLTRSVKKVVYGFQSLASIFEKNPEGFKVVSVITPETLPEPFQALPGMISEAVDDLQKKTGKKLLFEEINLDGQPDPVRRQIKEQYGIEPVSVSFFSDDTFYLHLLLQSGDRVERIYLAPDMDKSGIGREIEAALKRNGSGFTKTIGIWSPEADQAAQMGMMQHGASSGNYQIVQQILRENYNLQRIDMTEGRVGGNVDVLLVLAPQDMTDVERLAVDQYLMQGGTVVALAGTYQLDMSPYAQSLQVRKIESGINELLDHYGVSVGSSLVMDKQNEPFPIPVNRDIGGMVIQEIQLIDYPFFVDVRPENMVSDTTITSQLPAVTLNWVSPLTLQEEKLAGKKVDVLLKSSQQAWIQDTPEIEPDFDRFPQSGFAEGTDMSQQDLAVAINGSFSSFFKDKPDPRLEKEQEETTISDQDEPENEEKSSLPAEETNPLFMPLVTKSPSNTRLIVIGSSEFVSDPVISMSQGLGIDRFMNSLEFLQNVIDWSVADDDLLSIRSRGGHARILAPMTHRQQTALEWLNYGLALLALIVISLYGAGRRKKEKPLVLNTGRKRS